MPKTDSRVIEKRPPTCVIVEDEPDQRPVLCSMATKAGLEVVGEADNGLTAITMLLRLRPNLAFVDLKLPFASGTEVMSKTHYRLAQTKFIVVTGQQSPEVMDAAIRAGAVAFLLKPYDFSELSAAVTDVRAGRRHLGKTAGSLVWDRVLPKLGEEELKELSTRQTEVVRLIVQGSSNKEAAEFLDIAVRTVEKHREMAMKKIGVRSAADLTRYALRSGLIT